MKWWVHHGYGKIRFNLTRKRSLKTEIVPGGSKNRCSKRSGKTKEKRDGTIGLMGGFARPKARMISGVSLRTSAIYGRIYFGFLYKQWHVFQYTDNANIKVSAMLTLFDRKGDLSFMNEIDKGFWNLNTLVHRTIHVPLVFYDFRRKWTETAGI